MDIIHDSRGTKTLMNHPYSIRVAGSRPSGGRDGRAQDGLVISFSGADLDREAWVVQAVQEPAEVSEVTRREDGL
jgi:hypothetical protein